MLGRDRGLPVCDDYEPPFPWTGALHDVVIETGPAHRAVVGRTDARVAPPRVAGPRVGDALLVELLDKVDRWQQRHRPVAFVVAVIKKYGDDRGSQLAALITYYGFLAMFPLLLVFVTVLGYVAHDNPGVRHDLLNTALADFPVVGQELKRNVGALGGNGIALVVGLLALVWGSLGVAQVAQHTMAQVWNVPGARRPGFGPRLLRSVLVLAVLTLAIVGTAALTTVADARARRASRHRFCRRCSSSRSTSALYWLASAC